MFAAGKSVARMIVGLFVFYVMTAQGGTYAPARADVQSGARLSPQSLKVLVAGIAFYPDSVIEDILAASQDLVALNEAAAGRMPANSPIALQRLANYPEIITQLVKYPATTARLAYAARVQLADVWTAIDLIRIEFARSHTAVTEVPQSVSTVASDSRTSQTVVVPTVPVSGVNAFVAGLLLDDAVDEINGNTIVYQEVGGSAVVAVSENGAVTGAVVSDGTSTTVGVVAAGSATTPNGQSVSGVGSTTGTVTQTASGATYSREASGTVVNQTTGSTATGSRAIEGSFTENGDGSVSFSRSAATQTQGTNGEAVIKRSSSGTVSGNGDGTYSGSTSIESSRGNATVETEAGGGQTTSTVTTSAGTKVYTAGNGEIENRSGEGASTLKDSTTGIGYSSNGNVSEAQVQGANQMMSQTWSRLESDSNARGQTQPMSTFQRFSRGSGGSQGQSAAVPGKPNIRSQQPTRGAVGRNPAPQGRSPKSGLGRGR